MTIQIDSHVPLYGNVRLICQKLSFGFPIKRDSNQSSQLQRLASLDIILTKKRKIKALICLRGCADWSAPVFFANLKDRVSRVKAQVR